ncbi:MAG: hypothetical protein KBD01_06285 [Acidobacteria bacterium]|nr:hypothetical protein [Acidobacteriota bacterium]
MKRPGTFDPFRGLAVPAPRPAVRTRVLQSAAAALRSGRPAWPARLVAALAAERYAVAAILLLLVGHLALTVVDARRRAAGAGSPALPSVLGDGRARQSELAAEVRWEPIRPVAAGEAEGPNHGG